MIRLVAALAAVLVLVLAAPAAAYIVEITTSIALGATDDEERLRDALQAAVDDVLAGAVAFQPSLVVLTHAAVVGDRLFIRLLVADDDGERTFRDLHEPPIDEDRPAEPEIWI